MAGEGLAASLAATVMGGQPWERPQLPDVGAPLIPSGPQVSAGTNWANDQADRLSRGLMQFPGAMATSLAQMVATPGAIAQPNPYPEGTGEWQAYENTRNDAAYNWAPPTALGMVGSAMPFSEVGAVGAGGGKLKTKAPLQQMPQLAERYPEIAAPVPTIDPNTGRTYPAKGTSAEAAQLSKLRSAAQAEIDAGNYTPYFDPAKRFDVDPSNYPAVESTLTQVAKRPKEKAAAAYEAVKGPETTARIDEAFQRGLQQKSAAEKWYLMGQLEQEFLKEYGPIEGPKQFKAKFADAMAATTGGATPKDNLMMAQYGNYLKAHGQDLPVHSNQYPFPIADRLGNMIQFKKMMMEGSGLTSANPKRYNFSGNFLGNRLGSTIDEQMMGLIEPGGPGAPPKGAYGNYEQPINTAAQKAGYGDDPRDYQGIVWAGAKDAKEAAKAAAKGKTGGFKAQPMIEIVNEAIERTHRITGMAKDEIVRRGLVRGEIPIYGLGATLGGLAAGREVLNSGRADNGS